MSANNNSVVNASSNNAGAATNTQSLLRLPAELIDLVAQGLNEPDLLSFRATSRELRDASQLAFCRLFFDNVEVETSGSSSSLQELTDMLLSTNVPQAQHFATILGVYPPEVLEGWGMDVSDMYKRLSPSPADVTRLLTVMPNLVDVRIDQYDRNNHASLFPVVPVRSLAASIFLKTLTIPGPHLPHLQRLTLIDVCVDTDLLVNVLEAHKHTLNKVFLARVTLAEGRQSYLSWLDVFKAILSTEISIVRIFGMYFLFDNGESDSLFLPSEIRTGPRAEPDEESIGMGSIDTHQAKLTLGKILQAFFDQGRA